MCTGCGQWFFRKNLLVRPVEPQENFVTLNIEVHAN